MRSFRDGKISQFKRLNQLHFQVSFSDLAGHERYLKTTLYGLTSGAPSCVLLMVGANAGLIGMSKEHLAIALALSVPVVVCVTKVSRCHFVVNKTYSTPLSDRYDSSKQVGGDAQAGHQDSEKSWVPVSGF